MTRDEANAEIRRLIELVPMTERQIEATRIVLGEIAPDVVPGGCMACGGRGYIEQGDGLVSIPCECRVDPTCAACGHPWSNHGGNFCTWGWECECQEFKKT